MKEVKGRYGDFRSLVQKRRYLVFTFGRAVGEEEFWERWGKLKRELLFRRGNLAESKLVSYYILSKEVILSREELTERIDATIDGNSMRDQDGVHIRFRPLRLEPAFERRQTVHHPVVRIVDPACHIVGINQ